MCDFSLESVKSRPARVGDELETRSLGNGTIAFCDDVDHEVAVCLLPGTELTFAHPVTLHPWRTINREFNDKAHKVAIFRQLYKEFPYRHHDHLEFPGGDIEPLTSLDIGQRARVLQLPAELRAEVEREEQRWTEYAG